MNIAIGGMISCFLPHSNWPSPSAILIFRIYVLYSCRKWILIVLLSFFASCMTVQMTLFSLIGTRIQCESSLILFRTTFWRLEKDVNVGQCFFDDIPSFAYLSLLPTLLCETVLFFLCVLKTVHVGRQAGTGLMYVLLRDSFVYYGGVACLGLINILMWALGRVRCLHHTLKLRCWRNNLNTDKSLFNCPSVCLCTRLSSYWFRSLIHCSDGIR